MARQNGNDAAMASANYQRLADAMGDGFCCLDLDRRCTRWNRACEEFSGIPAHEAIGRSLDELFPHAESSGVREACLSAVQTGRPRRTTVEAAVKGGMHDLELTVCPCEDGVYVFLRDVTDQVRAERALRECAARHSMLLEEVPAVTYVAALDEDATPLYLSPQVEGLLGFAPGEFDEVPGLWLRQMHPEDRSRVMAQMADAVAAGQGLVTEYRMVRRDGRTVWFHDEGALVRDMDGKPLYRQGVAFDITDRKLAEEALRQSEERYRTLVELSPDAIAVLVDDRMAFANRAAAALLGVAAPEELVGREALELVHPDSRELARDRLRQVAMRRAGNPPAELKVRRHDGVELDLESVSVPVTYQGKPGVQLVFRDVTERKAAEQKLRDYGAALRSLASRISLIGEQERRRVASTLHDQIAQLLALSKIKLGVAQESAADAAMAARLQEVRNLIQQSLDFTRFLVFDLSPPLLYEMGLEAALSRLTEEMEKRYGVPTQFEDDGAPKPLRDDVRGVLFQAARELLINVVKHAGPCRVKVSTSCDDACVVVRVEDDGVGFDATGATLRLHEGGGLGLFNVCERLDHLGGRLELRSLRGRGTVATLVVPLEGGQDSQEGARP